MKFGETLTHKQHNAMTRTENGMAARKSSGSHVLNLFTKIGSARNSDFDSLSELFNKAYAENPELTVRVLLWSRDVLEGAGERETFRKLAKVLELKDKNMAIRVATRIPDLGRWDDLFTFDTKEVQYYAMDLLSHALSKGNKLAAKWSPREKSAKKEWAVRLRNHMGLTPKQYRKLLSSNTDVVENKMCNKEWEDINYSHVPSVAMSKYRSAFYRNDGDRFSAFTDAVEKGEEKINAKAIYPHTLIHEYGFAYSSELKRNIEVQWKNLPDFITNDTKILPICDVSGSMCGTPMDVSVSLGLYISERAKNEAFKDVVMTFDSYPQLVKLEGDFHSRLSQIRSMPWGMSTDFELAMKCLLQHAKQYDIPQDEMPEMLLVISDMQFNEAYEEDDTALEMMAKAYEQHGYKMPIIVFWNVDARNNLQQSMAGKNDENVVEISGFSPTIMKTILDNNLDDYTPYNIMLKTVGVSRYDF